MDILFKEDFIDKKSFEERWNVGSIHGSTYNIKDNKIIFDANSQWCGIYTQTKQAIDVSEKGKIVVEYDYGILSEHYSSADRPYVAFLNSGEKYDRDERYNMISKKSNALIIYLCDDLDRDARSKFTVNYKGKTLVDKKVWYKDTIELHIKIEIDLQSKKLFFSVDDKILMECDIEEFLENMSDKWVFEMNSNSYGRFLESYSNFIIKSDGIYKMLLNRVRDDKLLSFKKDIVLNLNKTRIVDENSYNKGFYDIFLLNNTYKKMVSFFEKDKKDSQGVVFKIKIDNAYKEINEICFL